jgi:ferric-dicitrate binding protein FerR (iron transport regulator)
MKGPTALSPGESAKWARWAADQAHLDEFRRVEAFWDGLGSLKISLLPTQQALDADRYHPEKLPVAEWLQRDR